MKVTVILIVIGALSTVSKELIKRPEDLGIRGQVKTKSIVEIGQNTEKSPGDLRRRTVTDSRGKPSANASVKNSQKSKIIMMIIIIIIITPSGPIMLKRK